MAGALEDFLASQRQTAPTLTAAQQKKLKQLIGLKGKQDTISAKELEKGQKKYTSGGEQFGDYMAAVAATFGEERFKGGVKQQLTQQGYTPESGKFIKRAPISGDILEKAKGAGYGEEDIRKYIAQTFAAKELGEGVGKFMGPSYTLNPDTGKFESVPAIPISGGDTTPPPITTSSGTGSGIYAGIDPDAARGNTLGEIEYALLMDPEKIRAKSMERQSRMSQQTALQAAKIGQGTSLYNLIPSAF
jgi:hypothetical protein